MPKPADVNPSLGRMLKKASRQDWFRWKPFPAPPPEFVRRFPEMKGYFDLLATLWNENESAIRRALEAIPDSVETAEIDTLSPAEEQGVRDIVNEMIVSIPTDSITEEEVREIVEAATDTYIHDQPVAATEWNVVHNLGRWPSVMVVDTANRWFIPEVNYINENRLIIRHGLPFAGKAYLN